MGEGGIGGAAADAVWVEGFEGGPGYLAPDATWAGTAGTSGTIQGLKLPTKVE